MNAIEAKNITKVFKIPHERLDTMKSFFVNIIKKRHFEVFKALDNVSFEVKKGEFFAIIGANGSGKSTLLKVLAKIYTADTGSLHIAGELSPFLELGIGFNHELSGRDNIYLNGILLGMSRKSIEEKFDDIVEFSGVTRFIDQRLKNYSSGMQVRLAFSIAIHANKDILLMDEVLAVGDNDFQKKCLQEFARYKRENKTVILVTHDTDAVMRYCDRALLMQEGKVFMIDEPATVINEYLYQGSSHNKDLVDFIKEAHVQMPSIAANWTSIPYHKLVGKLDAAALRLNYTLDIERSELKISILIFAKRAIKEGIFGVLITNSAGSAITSQNTLMRGLKDVTFSPGYNIVECTVQLPRLEQENHFLTLGIGEGTHIENHERQCWACNVIHLDLKDIKTMRQDLSRNPDTILANFNLTHPTSYDTEQTKRVEHTRSQV